MQCGPRPGMRRGRSSSRERESTDNHIIPSERARVGDVEALRGSSHLVVARFLPLPMPSTCVQCAVCSVHVPQQHRTLKQPCRRRRAAAAARLWLPWPPSSLFL